MTTNWSAYNYVLKRSGSLELWFDPEMVWVPPSGGKRGRQLRFSDAAIRPCLALKVLFGMPLRQTTGFVQGLLRLVGLAWAVPDYSTLCRCRKIPNVSLPYRGGIGPLNLLIDGTGIKSEGKGEWNVRRQGGPKRRIWHKIHIGVDAETLEVRAVEVTTSNVGEAPRLPELLNQIPPDQDIGSATADGAYDTRKCHDAIAERRHTAAKECQTAGAHDSGGHRSERSGQRVAIPRSRYLATVERIPSRKPCRNQDALYEIDGTEPHGAGPRPAGRRNPSPHRGAQPLYPLGIPVTVPAG